MSGQVLVHPSHICQIGESDQGVFYFPYLKRLAYVFFNYLRC
jgi:hypothetical protein